MIVAMEYAETERQTASRQRSAIVTRMSDTSWHLRVMVGGISEGEMRGLDRREAMQMARRWVETGEL